MGREHVLQAADSQESTHPSYDDTARRKPLPEIWDKMAVARAH